MPTSSGRRSTAAAGNNTPKFGNSNPIDDRARILAVDLQRAPSQERATRIARGADIVAAQAGCTFQEAVALMNARAASTNTNIEMVAIAVMAGDIRFG
jgi:hypothetical protein